MGRLAGAIQMIVAAEAVVVVAVAVAAAEAVVCFYVVGQPSGLRRRGDCRQAVASAPIGL